LIGNGVNADQIWLSRQGNDLEVQLIETGAKLTLDSWYTQPTSHVDSFQLSNGQRLLESQVEVLVQAMSSFAPPAPGNSVLSPLYHDTLTPIIAANWK
jgi:hypothetical protein